MPYSTGCKTPLSNFEAAENKVKVSDPEAFITFSVLGDPHGASFVAWTTTPWTLPSNLALCLNANFTYVKVRNKYSGKVYAVAESLLSAIHNPKKKPKEAVVNRSKDVPRNTNAKIKGDSGEKTENVLDSFEVLEKVLGASLVGTKYEPLFDYFKELSIWLLEFLSTILLPTIAVLVLFIVPLLLAKMISVFALIIKLLARII